MILIHDYVLRFNESVYPAEEFIMLTNIKLINENPPEVPASIQFLPKASTREKELTPLVGGRKHYLPLLNNDDFFEDDERWEEVELHTKMAWNFLPLEQVIEGFRQNIKKPLVGRIVKKSRLTYFGKHDDEKKDPFCYNFTIFIADRDTELEVVIWNTLCCQLFLSLELYDLVFLDDYKTVRSSEGYKISLNPSGPKAVVKVINESSLPSKYFDFYPIPDANFVARQEIQQLPDESIVDFCGSIIYVGRVERDRIPIKESYSCYRWLGLLDNSSEVPIFLKLYSCSKMWELEQVKPSMYFCGKEIRIESYISDSRSMRVPYLLSTFLTQYSFHPTIKHLEKNSQIVRFGESSRLVNLVHHPELVVGSEGFFGIPPPFDEYTEMNAFLDDSLLDSFEGLAGLVESIEIYEKKLVIVQGYLAQVDFGSHAVACLTKHENQSKRGKRAKKNAKEEKDELVEAVYSNPSHPFDDATIVHGYKNSIFLDGESERESKNNNSSNDNTHENGKAAESSHSSKTRTTTRSSKKAEQEEQKEKKGSKGHGKKRKADTDEEEKEEDGEEENDETEEESPISIVLLNLDGTSAVSLFSPPANFSNSTQNKWLEGLASVFPKEFQPDESEADKYFLKLYEGVKTLSSKRAAFLVEIFRAEPDSVEIVLTKIFIK